MPQTYTLSLKSEFNESRKLPEFVQKICGASDIRKELTERVMLALSEAATNAIVHGNREDIRKTVEVIVHIDEDSIVIRVEDEGEGFDPDKTPDPVQEENLLKTGGRGVFLMEEVADEVFYSDKGRVVTMTFNRQ